MNNQSFRGIKVEKFSESNVTVTGIPFDKNASIGKGASYAPDHLRELSVMIPATSMEGFPLNNIKLFDNGNITTEDFVEMQKEALKVISNDKFNIFLGGDHSVAIATERAFYDYAKTINKIPVIIHIDAHPDICYEYEDNKFSHACPNMRSLEYGYEDKNVTLIGIRGVEPQEYETFQKHPSIDVFKATDVRTLGAERLVSYLTAKYGNDEHIVYLSYDIDANDPAYAPGTGTPEPFGLDTFTVLNIVTGIIKNLNVHTMDLVEVSPALDINDITSYLAIKSIYEVLFTLQNKQ